MKGGKRPLGYTIVEVMIVLAVSGVLFVIASNFISGKQEITSFQQGSNELVSRLQTIIEEVIDGQYADVPMTCSVGSVQLTFGGSITPNQGEHPGCIFLGKLVHFTSRPGDSNNYEVFALAGARTKSDGTLVTKLDDTKLTPISAGLDLTVQSTLPQNLRINTGGIRIVDSTGAITTVRSAFGFMQGLGSTHALSDGTIVSDSGYQNISLIYNDAGGMSQISNIPTPTGAAAGLISKSTIKYAKSAAICITDGTRYARITVGPDTTAASQSQLSVAIKQLGKDATSCP